MRRGPKTSRHPDRDRITHAVVEWVQIKTGLGLGRGTAEPGEADACVVAAWIFSGYRRYAEYFPELKPPHNPNYREEPSDGQVSEWFEHWIEKASNYRFVRVMIIQEKDYFLSLFENVSDRDTLLHQLADQKCRTVRDSYQRHQRQLLAVDPDRSDYVKKHLATAAINPPRWKSTD